MRGGGGSGKRADYRISVFCAVRWKQSSSTRDELRAEAYDRPLQRLSISWYLLMPNTTFICHKGANHEYFLENSGGRLQNDTA